MAQRREPRHQHDNSGVQEWCMEAVGGRGRDTIGVIAFLPHELRHVWGVALLHAAKKKFPTA